MHKTCGNEAHVGWLGSTRRRVYQYSNLKRQIINSFAQKTMHHSSTKLLVAYEGANEKLYDIRYCHARSVCTRWFVGDGDGRERRA
jgi:hypothetical protein